MELRLGFLSSHTGSNVKAILDSIDNKTLEAEARLLICNNPNAGVLKIAEERNIEHYCINKNFYDNPDDFILEQLILHDVNLVVLAGYMKKIGTNILTYYPNRILNIHPSLLPKYGGKGMYGMKVHESVIAAKEKESGVTIHLVNSEYDSGKILAQEMIFVEEDDSPKTLADKILKIEHALYSKILRDIQQEMISLD